MSALKLGLPSKGRLQQDAIDWFAKADVTVARTGSDREYAGRVTGLDGIELVLLSASEIPRELAAGRIHLGVTGEDLIQEKLADWAAITPKVTHMGFGFADLIIAVPTSWADVTTLRDLDDAAAQFHANHGHRLRIATKYHNLVRGFLSQHGVADFEIVDSQGATEGTIKNQTAEAIADITSSGATLTANHLRILTDGEILKSQATLFAARKAHWSQANRETFATLCERLNLSPDLGPDL